MSKVDLEEPTPIFDRVWDVRRAKVKQTLEL